MEGPSLLLHCSFTVFASLDYIKLAKEKKHGEYLCDAFYGPHLEVSHMILITFHWLAHTWPPLTTRKKGNVFKGILRKKEWVW